ncbi:MAG TPA: hypothetical protein VKF42_09065 [Chitinivibrionales bacterium]|jgi:hypothetical protein|nr:hypothetical protein [Chitinivibrionales bacterium]
MHRGTSGCVAVFAAVVLIAAAQSHSRPISGVYSLKLTKPLSQDAADQIRGAAMGSFKIDLWEWLREEADVTVDTTNAIQRSHFNAFADTCLSRAKIDQTRSGHTATITISLSGEDARPILEAYNNKCYSISLRFYTLMKKALEDNASTNLYNLGVNTIYYTMGRMGTPIGLPDESTPRSFLLEETRKILQNFFNKFAVRSEEYIITGKQGTTLAAPFTVQVMADTVPLPGITIACVLAGGKKLCSGTSDNRGSISFSNFRIPYVAKGATLMLKPDFAAAVLGAGQFDANDLGVTVPDQTILFNTIPATFAISYKPNAANAVTLTKEFSSDGYISRFLRDSCFMAPAQPGGRTDLYFTIQSQVSSYSQDELEQTVLKLENEVTIENQNHQALARKQAVVIEKGFENSIPIPMGLFFWEATAKSMRMVKDMVKEL